MITPQNLCYTSMTPTINHNQFSAKFNNLIQFRSVILYGHKKLLQKVLNANFFFTTLKLSNKIIVVNAVFITIDLV